MRRSFLDLDIDHSPSSEPLSNLMQTREHANGTIFKIMVLPIYVALQPAALQTACRLTLAFKSQVSSSFKTSADIRRLALRSNWTSC